MRADKLLCAVGHVARHSLGAGKETQRGGRILEEFKYQFVDHKEEAAGMLTRCLVCFGL